MREALAMMKRRNFLALVGGVLALPSNARAQRSSAMPIVGVLHGRSPAMANHLNTAIRDGLREGGFVEGRDVSIEYRYASGQFDRFAQLAAELVERHVSVLIAGSPAGHAAKAATSTIAVVFVGGGDPVRSGLVSSLNRPGGNVTGISMLSGDLEAKRVGMLRELAPQATLFGGFVDDNIQPQEAAFRRQQLEAAGRRIGISIKVLGIRTSLDFDGAFAELARERAGALAVTGSTFFNNNQQRLIDLAARYAIPAIFELREFAVAGGLMSYAPSLTDAYRQGGVYAGRILKGERPGELPVLLPTKFELVVNLKTARVLGLSIPSAILAISDEVIE